MVIGNCTLTTAQVTFRGTAPQAVVTGEQFRVTYTLTTSSERGGNFQLSADIKGLQNLYGPTTSQSSSTTITNGNVKSQVSTSYTYVFMADQSGDYAIPPASIKVGDTEYKSNTLNIKALPPDKAAAAAAANRGGGGGSAAQNGAAPNTSGNEIFVRTIVGRASAYENEGIPVTFKLYSTGDFGVENIKFPDMDGFMVQEVELPQNRQIALENYNGQNYRTVVLRQLVLYPQHTGKIALESGKVDVVVRLRTQPQGGRRSIFDDFFEAPYQDVKRVIPIPAASITAKPLPAGKPAGFSGAVGSYNIKSSITSRSLKANEPVTIKIAIAGSGNVKMVKNPEIVFPNDFEVYDPKIDVQTKVSAGGVTGTKTIEYYAVPRYAGDFTIPAVSFSYFDLASETYKTVSTEAYELHVEPGADGSGSAPIVVGANKENVRFVGQDIRHIKTGEPKFHEGDYFFGTWGHWLWYLIVLMVFSILSIIYRQQLKENANITLYRTKRANKTASKRLKRAKIHLQAHKKEPFYDEILKAVWGYLSDKLNIPVASLTKENVETELATYGAKPALIQSFTDILNTAEFARFAPTSDPNEAMDKLYNNTVKAINQMESGGGGTVIAGLTRNPLKGKGKSKKSQVKPAMKAIAITLLLTANWSPVTAQEESPIADNQSLVTANWSLVTAKGNEAYTKGDYPQAVKLYEEALATNGESADVYYNLGNAYYRLNKVAPAILNYERAVLLNPGDKDARFNLEIAKLKTVDEIVSLDGFFLFEWWESLQNWRTTNQWCSIGIFFFVLLFTCLFIYFFSKKLTIRKIAFFTGIAALVFCLPANIFSYKQEQKLTNRNTAIIFAATITIKSAPDTSGTDLFILHEGTKVKIISKLGDWREIETADGNVGWIQGKEIEVI
ncbi:BatD protein [Candidatus Symbiothrix dinenymphae]|nr:BatD protein [Candidatus Symbiothrix dinenymphae]